MASPIVYEISPLPDFLADHTLAAEMGPDQLNEALARWINVVTSLHVRLDEVTYGLRFISGSGVVRMFFFAVPYANPDQTELAGEVEALLRAHRILTNPSDARVRPDAFAELSTLKKPVHAVLAQRVVKNLWTQSARYQSGTTGGMPSAPLAPGGPRADAGRAQPESPAPEVVLPWRGPGGPFLLPLEAMISQPIRTTVTVFASPTSLRAEELEWLRHMALAAQSTSDEMQQRVGVGMGTRQVDPAAALAGRIYETTLRRLSSNAYVTVAQVASEFGRADILRSVLAALRSQPLEKPLLVPDDEVASLPSASDELTLGEAEQSRLHDRLDVHGIFNRYGVPNRLRVMSDAHGTATLFRLPISIRGGVPGVEVRQLPPDFRPGPRREHAGQGEILVGRLRDGGAAGVLVNDLTRHILVTGFTGTGKTVTVLHLLHQLWIDHSVPFLVLESAKAEYRGFSGVQSFLERENKLRVYTLGNERGVPLRLNPFQLLPGVRVESHLSRLQSCIEASIPPVGPSSSMISEALVAVYKRHGWEITDQAPREGEPRRVYPMLSEFVEEIEQIIENRGYKGELKDNLQAALVGRFKPMMLGGKGRMLNTRRCDPGLDVLFREPVVLEMNDLNLDDKALVTMFILTLLREYRELKRGDGEGLLHLTVVEEAHNVLEDVGSKGGGEGATAADTRYQAVQAFCSMLAEIRSLGEGILIADQSPQKLAKDAVRNTNLQLAHQLRDADDRDAIATAMIMEDEQRDFLGKLGRGQAAMFRTGLEKATFVTIPQYYPNPSQMVDKTEQQLRRRFPGYGFRPDLSDDEVIEYMIALEGRDRRDPPEPLPGCQHCGSRCNEQYRDAMFTWVRKRHDPVIKDYVDWYSVVRSATRMKQLGWTASEAWNRCKSICTRAVDSEGIGRDIDAAWCAHVHAWAACSAVLVKQNGAARDQVEIRPGHRRSFVRATVDGATVGTTASEPTG